MNFYIGSEQVSREAYAAHLFKFGITLTPIQPGKTHLGPNQPIRSVHRADWPIWAKAMSQFSKQEDKGIGDVVLRIIGDEKSEAFKAWFQKIFKRTCGCDGRLAKLNALYPLP